MRLKTLFAAVSLAALAPVAAHAAQADNTNRFFATINAGSASPLSEPFNNSTGMALGYRAGWRWLDIVGPEIGFASLGRSKANNLDSLGLDNTTVSNKTTAALAGVSGKYSFAPKWSINAHGGYLRSRMTFKVDSPYAYGKASYNGNGWYAGAGVAYQVTPMMSLGLNYDNYNAGVKVEGVSGHTNIRSYTASAEFRF